MNHCDPDNCQCDAVEELEERLSRGHHRFVGISTTSGDLKFGWVHEVCHGILKLRYVLFFGRACPCAPLFAYEALVPVYQITDVLENPDMRDKPYREGFSHIDGLRLKEEGPITP